MAISTSFQVRINLMDIYMMMDTRDSILNFATKLSSNFAAMSYYMRHQSCQNNSINGLTHDDHLWNLNQMQDKYGTQRVVSFLRQLTEQGGFWRASDKSWVKLNRVQFVGACNPPTDAGEVNCEARGKRVCTAPHVVVCVTGLDSSDQCIFLRPPVKQQLSVSWCGWRLTTAGGFGAVVYFGLCFREPCCVFTLCRSASAASSVPAACPAPAGRLPGPRES